jgi:hypothetical protein
VAIKNQALTVQYQAWDTVANAAKTADVANHAIRGSGDGAIFTPAASPAEVDATNFPGLYKIALTAGEMNYNFLSIGGKSSTTGIVIVPVHITTERAALSGLSTPGASGGLPTSDASNGVKLSVGTGAGQANVSGGKIPATIAAGDYATNTPQSGDNFPRIGANGSGLTAIPDEAGVTTLLSRLSAARSGYLDNLNTGGVVATGSQVTNLRFSVRAAVDIPATMERPDSGSITIPFEVDIFNEGGAGLADPDSSAVTPAVVDNAGTDLSANFGGLSGGNLTRAAAGRYTGTYALASTHTLVELRFSFTWLRSTVAERIMVPSWVQDYTASAFTPSDRTNLAAVAADYMRRTDAVTVASGGIGAAAFAAGAIDASAFSQAAADKSWSTTARTLTAFGFSVAVSDKTGFALTTAEHTAVAADVAAALNTAIPGSPTANSIFARVDTSVGSRLATSGYTAPPSASTIAIATRDVDNSAPATGSLGDKVNNAASAGDPMATVVPGSYATNTAGYLLGTYLNASIAARATQASVDAVAATQVTIASYIDTEVAAIKAKTDNLPADPASNTQVNTRLQASSYTAPDNTSITAIKAKTDNLPADPASNTQVNTRLQGSAYVAPDNSGIAAILALVGAMPGGLAGTVQDTGATTAVVKTSGLPTSGTYPAAGASLIIMWTSGPLAGRAEEATYTPGAAGTQQLAFSPVLPTAPANGNAFVAYEIPPTA